MKRTILIVDDNTDFCKSLSENLKKRNYDTTFATNLSDAISIINGGKVGFILLDLMLGNEDGLALFGYLSRIKSEIPVIVMTGFSSVETAVQALKIGAKDYIKKPVDLNFLSKIIANHFEKSSKSESASSSDELLITNDPEMKELIEGINKIAPTDISVLISGENGTGKELVADYIYSRSDRKNNKIIKINCAAFPESLLDNELFGHEKGAYTGAGGSFKGVFETADGGTLFLDEIGDMTKNVQAKILRALQNREIKRIGSNEVINVDIRFIAATNKDLEQEIKENRFREDLYYRLNAAMFHVPPLRKRVSDITLLTSVFIEEANMVYEKKINGCSKEVENLLKEYQWPGNVRELKNSIFYAVAMSSDDQIKINDLPNRLGNNSRKVKILDIKENEKEVIIQALQKAYYNKKKAAEILGISRNTLYSKMKRYEIKI